MAGGCFELIVLFEELFNLVFKGLSGALGHLMPKKVENLVNKWSKPLRFSSQSSLRVGGCR